MILRMSPSGESPGPPRNLTCRPEREPSRDENGMIVCKHKDCVSKVAMFRRLCEYNKHMDRHERPYKCTNPACEQNPGFTYSGGLLRHQREVHKMHLAKDPLFCPHANCVRSSGAGFTRKENLEEHLRRRHPNGGETDRVDVESHGTLQILPIPLNRKRLRQAADDGSSPDSTRVVSSPTEEGQEINRLRLELTHLNQLVVSQSHELNRLRNFIRALPPQIIYSTSPHSVHAG